MTKTTDTVVMIPCFSCGTLVKVRLPFYGCVFCGVCNINNTYYAADTEDFKRHISPEPEEKP